MRKTLITAALMLLSPLAYATTIDAGSVSCSLSECPGPIEEQNKAQYKIMDFVNCNGHGHVKSSGFCNMTTGHKAYVKVVVAGERKDWWFNASCSGSNCVLTPTLPPPSSQTFRVFFQQHCYGAYVDTGSWAQAQSVEGGIRYTIFYPPADPDPTLCWYVAAEGSQ